MKRYLTEDEHEELAEKRDQFTEEFARLVRKYAPLPTAKEDFLQAQLVSMLQDMTSCYSPYVWSEEFDPKET